MPGFRPDGPTLIYIYQSRRQLLLLQVHPHLDSFLRSRAKTSDTLLLLPLVIFMEQVLVSPPLVEGKESPLKHPLGPLTAAEISESARLIKQFWPTNTNLQFKSITLREPNKVELALFLAAEHAGQRTPTADRRSFVLYYIRNTVCYFLTLGLNSCRDWEPRQMGTIANVRAGQITRSYC